MRLMVTGFTQSCFGKKPCIMKNLFLGIFLFSFSSFLFATSTDTTYHENGAAQYVKKYEGTDLVEVSRYDKFGNLLFWWSIEHQILETFGRDYGDDALFYLFKEKCQNYNYYLHYHSGGLEERIPFKNGKMHGLSEHYNGLGKLSEQGKYREGQRVGIWTYYYPSGKYKEKRVMWFEDSSYGGGLSVDYFILPFAITLLLLASILAIFSKFASYAAGFYIVGGITMATFDLAVMELCILEEGSRLFLAERMDAWTGQALLSSILFMSVLAIVTLFLYRKKVVNPFVVAFFLIFVLLLFVLIQIGGLWIGFGTAFEMF